MSFIFGKIHIGAYYKSIESFMLFPSIETISSVFINLDVMVADPISGSSSIVPLAAKFWSRQLKVNVVFIENDDNFITLEQNESFLKILTSDGKIGWIFFPNKEWAFKSIERLDKNNEF